MGRSRNSAKQAGARFERSIADYLAIHVDDRIDRRVKTGSADCGDIAAVRTRNNERLVLECKDYGGRLELPQWLREAHTECDNDNALAGLVVAKRRGTTNPGDQFVICTVDDLVALLTGGRPTTLDGGE